jgi:hypothetical protein
MAETCSPCIPSARLQKSKKSRRAWTASRGGSLLVVAVLNNQELRDQLARHLGAATTPAIDS